MVLFMGKAQNIINSSMDSIHSTINDLQNAMCCCENSKNKKIIQSAIDSINCACSELSKYED